MVERQLNLLKGPRQKGERLPSPKETNVHVALVAFVKQWILPGWTFSHFANGGWRDKRTAALMKAFGTKAGMPDLVFFGPGERVFFLELKRKGEHLSDAQKQVHFDLMRAGFRVHITDDLEDAVAQLNDLGIVRARVSA